MDFYKSLKKFLFDEGGTYSLVDKYAMLIPLLFLIYTIPINFIPNQFLVENEAASLIISKNLIKDFKEGNIKEITMTNMQNFFNDECYAKQTFTKYDKILKMDRTYTYWLKYCTGDVDYLYDFKLVMDKNEIKFYSHGIPIGFIESMEGSFNSFGLNVSPAIEYFNK